MSSIAVTASASGTGTVSLVAPVTNSDRTITLPDATGTMLSTATAGVPVNGPAFSAYNSNQAIANNTFTKLACSFEVFDTNSNYDNATNYRFTPTVAGYYQINGHVALAAALGIVAVSIYKNGGNFYSGSSAALNTGFTQANVSGVVYLNGSTDYVELYTFQNSGGSINTITASGPYNYFNGALVRSAV
jgi:hypothetical protein